MRNHGIPPKKHAGVKKIMSETTNIDYTDKDGKGNATLYINPFKNGKNGNRYYARFDRDNVDINHMIARIRKKDVGVNPITAKHILSLYKVEILEALQRGESVNLMDLGTFYISATGTTGNTEETANVGNLNVKFSPSKETKDSIATLGIRKFTIATSGAVIDSILDLYSGILNTSLTSGKSARISGNRLKISGEEGRIFFVPVDTEGNITEDESTWIPVEEGKITRNKPSVLEFFLPDALTIGNRYSIALKSNCCSGSIPRKSYNIIFTAALEIQ